MIAQATTFDIEAQLALAAEVQRGLLPKPYCCIAGWEAAFSYEPAGHISGDYLDLIPDGDNAFYFILGDVSGKGIAASLLMSHLHATVRGLLASSLTLEEVVRETSRLFCHTSLPAQFATLVLGHASSAGQVDLVNAGHTPVLLAATEGVTHLASTGVPLGLFCANEFETTRFHVEGGDVLLLYSDGVSETEDGDGAEYGVRAIELALRKHASAGPQEIIAAINPELELYVASTTLADDRSMLALRYQGPGTLA